MFTLRLDADDASLAAVRKRFRLREDDVDADFGLVSIDPEASLFAILVSAGALEKLSGDPAVAGPYSNPRIESFGPPS